MESSSNADENGENRVAARREESPTEETRSPSGIYPLAARPGTSSQRLSRRFIRVVGFLLLLHALQALSRVLRFSALDEATAARSWMIVFLFAMPVALYLLSRPLPRYPIQAAVGTVLVAAGAMWLGYSLVTSAFTWVLIYDVLPDRIAWWLLGWDVHRPETGLLMFGVGGWAVLSATSTKSRHRWVVLEGEPEPDLSQEVEADDEPEPEI